MTHLKKSPTRSTPALPNESAGNDINPLANSGQPIVFDLRQHESGTAENEDAYWPDSEDLQALRITQRLAWCYFVICCLVIAGIFQTHPEIWAAMQKCFSRF